jgi:hypothetical protein
VQTYDATVKLWVRGRQFYTVAEGSDSLSAYFLGLIQCLCEEYPFLEEAFIVDSVTVGDPELRYITKVVLRLDGKASDRVLHGRGRGLSNSREESELEATENAIADLLRKYHSPRSRVSQIADVNNAFNVDESRRSKIIKALAKMADRAENFPGNANDQERKAQQLALISICNTIVEMPRPLWKNLLEIMLIFRSGELGVQASEIIEHLDSG